MNKKPFVLKFVGWPLLILAVYLPMELWRGTFGLEGRLIDYIIPESISGAQILDTLMPISLLIYIGMMYAFATPILTNGERLHMFTTYVLNILSFVLWTGLFKHSDPDFAWYSLLLWTTFAMLFNISGILKFLLVVKPKE